MAPFRWLSAAVATVLVAAVMAACTGGDPADGDGGPSASPPATTPTSPATPAEPTTPPPLIAQSTMAALRPLPAAAVEAVSALRAVYPELGIIGIHSSDTDAPIIDRELYEQHDWVEDAEVYAVTNTDPHGVALWIDVFADEGQARSFRTSYAERYLHHDPVAVAGWPGVADLRDLEEIKDIQYSFVHDQAVVRLSLRFFPDAEGFGPPRIPAEDFDTPEAVAAELSAALDLVKASLDETMPVPG